MVVNFQFSRGGNPSVNTRNSKKVRVFEQTPQTIFDLQESYSEQTFFFDKKTFIDRSGVNHYLKIGSSVLSSFLISFEISRSMGKDDQCNITLDNTEFKLSDLKVLNEGHVVTLAVFDGVFWKTFNQFIVVDVTRDYDMSGKINLSCRTNQIRLQLSEVPHKWENVLDSDVIIDIAKRAGLKYSVTPTKIQRKSVALSAESISTFVNKLAQRNGYEWKVENDTFYFRPPQGSDTNITLNYRPFNGVGEIISAKKTKQTDSKKGSRSKARVTATDFEQGTIDSDTVSESMEQNEGFFNRILNQKAKGNTNATSTDSLKNKLDDKKIVRYEFNTDVNDWVPIAKEIEVSGKEQASTATEADVIASGINATNAYDHVLNIETYGMNDIDIRQIITINGLAAQDNGKWLLSELKAKYDAKDAYRMSLVFKSNKKPFGGSGLPESISDLGGQNKVKPHQESEPESGYKFNFDRNRWDREVAK